MASLADHPFSRAAFSLQNNIQIETSSFIDPQRVAYKHFRLYSNQCLYSWRPSSGLSGPRFIGVEAESCAIVCHSLKSLKPWIRVHGLKAVSQERPEIPSSVDSWSICTSIWTRRRGAQRLYALGCFQRRQPVSSALAAAEENWRPSPYKEVYCCGGFQYLCFFDWIMSLIFFSYILSNCDDKTSLWFKPKLSLKQKYTEVIPKRSRNSFIQ